MTTKATVYLIVAAILLLILMWDTGALNDLEIRGRQ